MAKDHKELLKIDVGSLMPSDDTQKLNDKNKLDFIGKVYAFYPRKMGKKKGFKKLQKRLKTVQDCRNFFAATYKYCEYIQNNHIEKKYVTYFITFVNNYEDWLDHDAGGCNVPHKDIDDLMDF